MGITRTMLAPIVAVLAMAVQLLFDIKITEELQNQIVDVIFNASLVVVAVYGVFKNHQKE